jgi:hypothetical protein
LSLTAWLASFKTIQGLISYKGGIHKCLINQIWCSDREVGIRVEAVDAPPNQTPILKFMLAHFTPVWERRPEVLEMIESNPIGHSDDFTDPHPSLTTGELVKLIESQQARLAKLIK